MDRDDVEEDEDNNEEGAILSWTTRPEVSLASDSWGAGGGGGREGGQR